MIHCTRGLLGKDAAGGTLPLIRSTAHKRRHTMDTYCKRLMELIKKTRLKIDVSTESIGISRYNEIIDNEFIYQNLGITGSKEILIEK